MERKNNMPALPEVSVGEVAKLKENIKLVEVFIGEALEAGIDFGLIPGTTSPTLFEPGASKILNLFNACDDPEIIRFLETDRLISITVKSYIKHRLSGLVLATGIGACSTTETKYKYRWVENPEEYGFDRSGLKAKQESKRLLFRIPNPEWEELINTVLKMAKKRAMVDAAQDLPGVASALRKRYQELTNEQKEEAVRFGQFWARARAMGLTEEDVNNLLGVNSMKEWLAQGKTLKEALEVLAQKARLL